ncbi:FkbM family methyltransferase [Sporomusa termitida]|nr:FkbM family methyltransferase [Sporomusa termitida]
MEFKEKIAKIIDRLGDEESKRIFEARLLYSLTGNLDCFDSAVLGIQKISSEKPVAIFGCGQFGQFLVEYIQNAVCFIDNYANKANLVKNLPVLSLDEFIRRYDNVDVVIGSIDYYDDLKAQLNRFDIPVCDLPVCFQNLFKKMQDQIQYFDFPYLEHAEHEVFVDGGCLDGNTSLDFIQWSKSASANKNIGIILFEPNQYQVPVCETALRNTGVPFKIIQKALSDCVETLKFNSAESDPKTASISNDGDIVIETVRMDDVLKDERITFIKLDIEGAELRALRGMKKIISNQKPKLAISVYHKPEDIWEIPLMICEVNENYKFYLRHYSWNTAETVLYAI